MEWRGALLALLLAAATAGFDDPHVSQISPNSAYNPQLDQDSLILETSEVIDLLPSIAVLSNHHGEEPNLNTKYIEEPSLNTEYSGDYSENSGSGEISQQNPANNGNESPHVIVVRSADPIVHNVQRRSKNTYNDHLGSSKNVEESFETNDVEVHQGPRYYNQIMPTKTQPQSTGIHAIMSSIMETGKDNQHQGEAKGVPRGRALSPKGPHLTTNAQRDFASSVRFDSTGRQANPDIQDIITGIVKLLNGNVNVQANTQPANSRPGRPPNTRINNRGPPRISDVPPLPPDFDTPGNAGPGQMLPPVPPQTSTKIPPPYPFDRPPLKGPEMPPIRPFLNGIPLPEQIVPVLNNNQNYRPNNNNNGFINNGRPQNIPPWQRPRPRPQMPNRRPNPNLPMYNPQPTNNMEPPPQIYVSSEESATSAPLEEPVLKPKPYHEVYTKPEIMQPQENEKENEHLQPNDDDKFTMGETGHKNDDNTTINETFTHKETEYETADEEDISFVRDRDPPVSTDFPTPSNVPYIEEKDIQTTSEKPAVVVEPTKQQVMKDGEISDKKKQTMIKVEKEKPSNKKQEDKVKEAEQSIKNTIRLSAEDAIQELNNNSHVFQHTPDLESSKVDFSSSAVNSSSKPVTSSTPTEQLPSIFASTANSSTSSSTSVISVTPTKSSSILPATTDKSGTPQSYRPRPGIVLDDLEFRPGGGGPGARPNGTSPNHPPYRPRPQQSRPQARPMPGKGEIFDVTVSAIQGPGGGGGSATVHIESVNPLTGQPGDIIVSASGDQGFVSIDGKRTYLNLLGEGEATSTQYRPTSVVKPTAAVTGTGYAVPEIEAAPVPAAPHRPTPPRRTTQQPSVRIDTCIVGDDSTCDQTQNERCKTDNGISSCHCRPGFARRNHRDPCRKVSAMVFSLRVDRMYDRKVTWDNKLNDKESEPYQQLSYEAVRAVDSAFSMTPYSDEFVSGSVNTIYKGIKGETGVFVNVTVLLEEAASQTGGDAKAGADITRHLLGVIQRRSNNVGQSALWVDQPRGSVSPLQDLDECSSPELNDCHELATCTNVWGSFKCACPEEARDAWSDQVNRAGRNCHTCPPSHCSNRGTCSYRGGQPVCSCTGAYYGSQCEVDGEVVGVAVGASLAALLVILITLACLVMWSRRWNREQKSAAGMGSPVFGYMTGGVKAPNMGHPPYQVSLEERMRWAQLADVMAQANHYAQPEPLPGHPGARPPSGMYGAYPTLPAGTLPPVPRPRLGLHMGGSTMHLNNQSKMNTSATMGSRANTLSGLGHSAFSTLSGTWLNGQQAESSSSDSDSRAPDRTDLLGARGFHVPRPKSRSNTVNSMANQSGIYYDVDYENAPDPIYGSKGIPLSTYTLNRNPPFYGQ